MAVSTQVVRFTKDATNVDGATQDVNLNFTPKAIIVMSSGSTTDNTFADGYNAIYGFSDGTSQACVSNVSQDLAASGNTGRTHRTDSVFCQLDPADGTTVLSRASAAFATNKVTLTWTVNDSLATYIVLVAYGGTDITNAKVATVDNVQYMLATQDYTGLGFTPTEGNSVLFTLYGSAASSSELNTQMVDATFSFGCAVSPTKRWCLACDNEDVTASMDTDHYFVNDEVLTGLFPDASGRNFEADFNGWVTDGFQLIWEDAPGADTTRQFSYLVIKGGTWDCGNDTAQQDDGTKNHTVSVSSQTIRGLLCVNSYNDTAFNAAVAAHASYSIGVTDGTNSGHVWSGDANGVADAYTAMSNSGSGRILGHSVLTTTASSMSWYWAGAFSSFGTNQFTLSYTGGSTNLNAQVFGWVVVADSEALTAVEKALILRYNLEQQIVKQLTLRYNLEQTITKQLTTRYDITSLVDKALTLRYDITSLVEKVLTTRYDISSLVTKVLSLRYDISKEIEKPLTLRYDISQAVEKALTILYNIEQTIEQVLTLRYNIEALGLESVEKVLTLRYDINAQIEKSLITRYNIEQEIQKTVSLRYDITSLIEQTLTLRYNLEQEITKQLTLRYDVTTLTEKSLTLRYNLEQEITKTLTLLYDIESALTAVEKALTLRYDIEQQIEKSLTTRYDITNQVADKSLTLRYDITSLVEKINTLRYDIAALIEKPLTLRYNIIAEVPQSLTLRYNIEAELQKVLTLRYAIDQQLEKTSTIRYHIEQEITKQLITRYDITTLLEKALTFRYDITTLVPEKSLTLRYNITSLIEKVLSLRYDVVARTEKSVNLRYDITALVTKILNLRYNLDQQLTKPLTLRYNIEQQITKQLTIRYDVEALAQVIKALTLRYNIEARIIKALSLRYNIDARLLKSLILRYDITNLVPAKSLTLRWNIDQQIVKTLIIRHQIEASIARYISDPGYSEPLRCRIRFVNRNNIDIVYYDYNSFTPNSRPFNLQGLDVRLAMGETGAFTMTIEDSAETVDKSLIGLGNKIIIEVKKESGAEWMPLLTGFVRRIRPIREATGTLQYQITGYGSQIVFNERITNFKRAAKRTGVDSNIPLSTDSKMEAWNLFNDLVTASDVLPLRKPTVQNTGGFTDLSGISSDVSDFIGQIAPGLTDAASVANAISEITGAVWGCDANGNPYFRYPTSRHSGIIITDAPVPEDAASTTSINMAPFEYDDNIDITEGFANRLYVLNAVSTKSTSSSSEASGSTTLTYRGIAQQFTANDNNITSAAFILSKIGNPVNKDNCIFGYLRADNGNGYPTGATLASFSITLDQIEPTKSTVFVNDIKTEPGVIIPGNKYWWFLFGALNDDSNTIRWHHDNDMITPDRLSATVPFVDADPTKTGNQFYWIRSVYGPTYAFSTFSSVRHILEHSDPESIQRYGLIEGIVDLPAFEDDRTFQKALAKIIATSAKPKRLYQYNLVTIPTQHLFMPGELVTVIDSKAKLTSEKNVIAEIAEVNYQFDTTRNALGCKYCDVHLIGFLDQTLDDYLDDRPCQQTQ